MKKLIPKRIENKIPSNKFVYYFCWLIGLVTLAANNVVSIFAQWGFSQLVLACILLFVVFLFR